LNNINTTIVFFGKNEMNDSQNWLAFYNYTKKLANEIGCPINFIGSEFTGSKIAKVSKEKLLINALERNKQIKEGLSLYHLLDEVEIDSNLYNLYCCRAEDYLFLSISKSIYNNISEELIDSIISELSKYIEYDFIEIFELDKEEIEENYICNRFEFEEDEVDEDLQSLKIIKTIKKI